MKLLLFLVTLSTGNAFLFATRAISTPGFSLKSLQKAKPAPSPKKVTKKKVSAKVASATDAKEWRWFGRDRDSKSPPLFLKQYDGSAKLGKYPELSGSYKPEGAVKRNPYKNNCPVE